MILVETFYPVIGEIININKVIGSNGATVNKGNLAFTLDKAKNAKTLMKKAVTLLVGIIEGHPFVDGNKRTAFVKMELFLQMNGKELDHSKADEYLMERVLYDIAEKRISGEFLEKMLSELTK